MSETPMTEARIEEIVALGDTMLKYENRITLSEARWNALIADWRAKKAEIEDLTGALNNFWRSVGMDRAAEATRAKCEAIAREWPCKQCDHEICAGEIADAIAALKQSSPIARLKAVPFYARFRQSRRLCPNSRRFPPPGVRPPI